MVPGIQTLAPFIIKWKDKPYEGAWTMEGLQPALTLWDARGMASVVLNWDSLDKRKLLCKTSKVDAIKLMLDHFAAQVAKDDGPGEAEQGQDGQDGQDDEDDQNDWVPDEAQDGQDDHMEEDAPPEQEDAPQEEEDQKEALYALIEEKTIQMSRETIASLSRNMGAICAQSLLRHDEVRQAHNINMSALHDKAPAFVAFLLLEVYGDIGGWKWFVKGCPDDGLAIRTNGNTASEKCQRKLLGGTTAEYFGRSSATLTADLDAVFTELYGDATDAE